MLLVSEEEAALGAKTGPEPVEAILDIERDGDVMENDAPGGGVTTLRGDDAIFSTESIIAVKMRYPERVNVDL